MEDNRMIIIVYIEDVEIHGNNERNKKDKSEKAIELPRLITTIAEIIIKIVSKLI